MKKIIISILCVFVMLTNLHITVFAESNMTVEVLGQNDHRPYIDEEDEMMVSVHNAVGEVTYRWERLTEDNTWQEIDNSGNSLKFEAFSYTVAHEEYRCIVTDEGGGRDVVEFTLDPRHSISFGSRVNDEYVNIDGTCYIESQLYAIDYTRTMYKLEYIDPYTNERSLLVDDTQMTQKSDVNFSVAAKDFGTYVLSVWDPVFPRDSEGPAVATFNVHIRNNLGVTAIPLSQTIEQGEVATLRAEADADDTEGITYKWEYLSGDEWVIIEGADTDTHKTSQHGHYCCTVTDKFLNTESCEFTVYLNNSFSASVKDMDPIESQEWNNLYKYELRVAYGEEAVIEILPSGNDLEGVSYSWSVQTGPNSYNWLEENGSTLELGAITENRSYNCYVRDNYENTIEIQIAVIIENHFDAYASSSTYKRVRGGSDVTFEVSATADNGEITYKWSKLYPEEEEIENDNSPSLTITGVTESATYTCEVSDIYGATKSIYFNVVVQPESDYLVLGENEEYQVYDYNNQHTHIFGFVPEESDYYTFTISGLDSNRTVTLRLLDENDSPIVSVNYSGTQYISSFLQAGVPYYLEVYCPNASRNEYARVIVTQIATYTVSYFVNQFIEEKNVNPDGWDIPYTPENFSNYIALQDNQVVDYWMYNHERFYGPVSEHMVLEGHIATATRVNYHLRNGVVHQIKYTEDPIEWNIDYTEEYLGDDYQELDGLMFKYWSATPDGEAFYGEVTDGIDLYAVFSQTVNVHYFDDDGEPLGTKQIEVPEDPRYLTWWIGITSFEGHSEHKDGLRFYSWSNSLGSKEVYDGIAFEGLELYAIYVPEYNVTYHLDDNTAKTVKEPEGGYPNDPRFIFDDYEDPSDGTMFWYWADETGEAYRRSFDSDVELWAVYGVMHHVTLKANGEELLTVGVFEGDEYYLPDVESLNNYTPVDDQVFLYWSLTEEGEEFTGSITEDITLFAVFTQGVEVKYFDEDGTLIGKKNYVDGSDQVTWVGITMFTDGSEYKGDRKFAGWTDVQGGTNYYQGVAFEGLELYALYLKYYNITYEIHDGRTTDREEFEGHYPPDPQYLFDDYSDPDGQGFAYWKYEDGTKFENGFYRDAVLTAEYGVTRKVTYHLDDEEIGTKYIAEGNQWGFYFDIGYFGIELPERKEFGGWATADGTYFNGPVTEDIDLYAIIYDVYDINFYQGNKKLGTKTASNASVFHVLDTTDITEFEYEQVEGKVFTGWRDANGHEVYSLNSDINVYAQFEEVMTITYHLPGGDTYQRNDATSTEFYIDEILYARDLVPDNYTIRYMLAEDANRFVESSIPEGTTDLYVLIVKEEPVITFNPNYSTAECTTFVMYHWYDNRVILSAFRDNVPTREGYLFAGWTYDAEGNSFVQENDLILEDITLYAKWISPDESIVNVRIQGFADYAEYTITGNNVIYDSGAMATVRVAIDDDFSYISMYEIHYRETDRYDIQEFERCLSKEITFEVKPGLNEVYVSVYKGLNTLTFIVDEDDRSKDVVLTTDRYDRINLDDIPSVEKEGYFHYGWTRYRNYSDYVENYDFSRMSFNMDQEFFPLLAEEGVESTVSVEFLRLYYDENEHPKYEVFTPADITVTGTGNYDSGDDYTITVNAGSYYILRSKKLVDGENNDLQMRLDEQITGNYFRFPVLGRNGYTVSGKVLPGTQKISFYVAQDGTVRVVNNMPDLVTISNNAANGIKAGETVNIHFDIADGYALDQNKPFIMDDVFMNHYYDSVALDGDILKVLTMTKNGYDYDLNPEVITVTEDNISWVMGAANFMFTPNIIFVGYNTQTEQDISDILDTNGEDEYSAPGIVFYNESSEAKSYTVDFTKPGSTQASGELHSAGLMAKRGLLKSSVVEPVEGEDGIGSYVLYVTTGKVGEAGTKLEPIHVANLKSLNVTVEAGEFVTYSVVPDEGNETEINDIQFEVKDEEENVVQTGYISTDDTSKHLVYEEAVATQTPVNYVGTSLDLDGIINMNFYFKVPEEYEGAYAVLKDEMGNRTEVDLSTVPYSDKNGYKVTYPNIVAKRMMMKIELTVCDKDGNVIPMERKGSLLPNGTFSYCVTDYVNDVLMTSSRAYSKDLAYAILNYGQSAQYYFSHNLENLPNPNGYLSEEMASLEADHRYDQVGPEWDQYIGASLDLEGAISSYLYFRVPITATRVNSDGTESALPVVQNANGYRVEIRNIAAKRLHEMYTIRVKYNGNVYEYKTGAFSYVNRVLLPKADPNKSNLGKALYLYNKAARLYFNY